MKSKKDQSNTRSGFSLIELLVATLLMTIIFIGWLSISNFQAIRKESFRRLALETASGYLDVMATQDGTAGYFYRIGTNLYAPPSLGLDSTVQQLFEADEPIGYTLQVIQNYQTGDWPALGRWAVINLYDKHGCSAADAGRPFSTMSVFMK